MTSLRAAVALLCLLTLANLADAAKKKKEDITQTLELPKDPPNVISADPHRLVFRITPLSNKGLLSAQTREAVKALIKQASGDTVVRIRAFVAGSGDLRRVPQIVSEVFTSQKLALPVVSVVQTGGLPMTGAQVLLESIAIAKKGDPAPEGLLFVPVQEASVPDPSSPTSPLANDATAKLDAAIAKGGGAAVMRVTCYLSSLADAATIAATLGSHYPQAAVALVQSRRAALNASAACEATAKLTKSVDGAKIIRDGDSALAAVSAPAIELTGTIVAYGYEDRNARQLFERMNRILEPEKASWKTVVSVQYYPLAASIVKQIARVKDDFMDAANPPASSMTPIEGLPSVDASFAMDAIAIPR